jgi:hypothetical protein
MGLRALHLLPFSFPNVHHPISLSQTMTGWIWQRRQQRRRWCGSGGWGSKVHGTTTDLAVGSVPSLVVALSTFYVFNYFSEAGMQYRLCYMWLTQTLTKRQVGARLWICVLTTSNNHLTRKRERSVGEVLYVCGHTPYEELGWRSLKCRL